MYKLIVVDLDETLLNDEHQVTVRTIEVIRAVLKKGIRVVFASGRAQNGIMKVIELFGTEMHMEYVICFNGAKVQNLKTQESITDYVLNGSDLKEIYHFVLQCKLSFYAFDQESIITNQSSKYTFEEAEKNRVQVITKEIDSVMDNEKIYKIVVAGQREALDRFEKEIPQDFRRRFSVVRSHNNNLEILHPLANKAEALRTLSKRLKVPLSEIMAFGNANNDIGMVDIAGKGIAMGNAFNKVIEVADYVADNNNQDGVGKALEKFILNQAFDE